MKFTIKIENMKVFITVLFTSFMIHSSYSQTLFTPSGTIGSSENGNVGVGTSSPVSKLDVEGGDLYIGEESSANGTRRQLRIYGYDHSTKFFGSLHSNYDDSKRTFDITASDAQQIKIDVSGNSYGRILLLPGTSGNIGIGTLTPSAKLDVEGGDFHLGNEVSNNGERRMFRIYGYDNNSQFYGSIHSNWEDSKRTFDIYTSSSTNQLKIDASANPNGRIAILPGENVGVGIGTLTTGSHKLAVDGSIGAREVKVEAAPGWSDFVFENDYKLRTLEEVEQHIDKKGHLPEIPSEAEVAENGINLGEMDAKLLMKIEELTLYLIEQNKELKFQRDQNLTQQEQLETQLTLIEQLQKQISALKNE